MKKIRSEVFRHYLSTNLVRNKPVETLLVGAGGNGGPMITGLARMNHALIALGHPGIALSVIDGDEVAPSNVGRQMFSPADIGRNKAVVAVSRVNMFFGLKWQAFPAMLQKDHLPDIRKEIRLVIAAVDNVRTRKLLNKAVQGKEMYLLDLGNGKDIGQVILGTGDYVKQPKTQIDCIGRLPTVMDLFPKMKDEEEAAYQGPTCGIAAALQKQDLFVNTVVSTFALDLLWKGLRQGYLTFHGAFINLDSFKVNPLLVDPAAWERMGWMPSKRGSKLLKAA